MTAVPNSWFIDVIYFTQDAVMHKVQLFLKDANNKNNKKVKYLVAIRQWIQQIDTLAMKIKRFQVLCGHLEEEIEVLEGGRISRSGYSLSSSFYKTVKLLLS